MFGMSGFQTAILLMIAVGVVILGLMLLHARNPQSKLSQFEDRELKAGVTWTQAAEADVTRAYLAAKTAVEAEIPTLRGELQAILTAAEKRLTNLTGPNQDIADAQKAIADANAEKATRLDLVKAHIANLQAHVDAQSAPPAA